jgi:hypothetical protein
MADEKNQLSDKRPIPKEEAYRICDSIRAQYRGKWWTAAGMQCWGCTTFTKGDPEKFCVTSAPGYRGCGLVSARYDEQFPS